MITFEILKNAIESEGYNAESYSGRNMYGKECLSYTTDDVMLSVVGITLSLSLGEEAEESEIRAIFRKARTDSMGRETVVYFPLVKWEGSEQEDEEED